MDEIEFSKQEEFYVAKEDLPTYLLGDDFEGMYIDIEYTHNKVKDAVHVKKVFYYDMDVNIKCQIKLKEVSQMITVLNSLLKECNYNATVLKSLSDNDNKILKLLGN